VNATLFRMLYVTFSGASCVIVHADLPHRDLPRDPLTSNGCMMLTLALVPDEARVARPVVHQRSPSRGSLPVS
jgi:hypothetical protein